MRPVETADQASVASFAVLAERSGFSTRECALAACTGRLADIVKVAQRRDAGRKRALASLPPVPPTLSGKEALIRLKLRDRQLTR